MLQNVEAKKVVHCTRYRVFAAPGLLATKVQLEASAELWSASLLMIPVFCRITNDKGKGNQL